MPVYWHALTAPERSLNSLVGYINLTGADKHGAYLLHSLRNEMVVGEGFEPSKSVTADLQSAPFGRSGTPPGT